MQNLGNQVTGGAAPATSNVQPYPQTAPTAASQLINMHQSPLDESWKGQGGKVLFLHTVISDLCQPRSLFDGQYRLGQKQLLIHDPKSNKTQSYEFAHNQGRLVLKGTNDQLLLFRKCRFSCPVPPRYNRGSPLPQQ